MNSFLKKVVLLSIVFSIGFFFITRFVEAADQGVTVNVNVPSGSGGSTGGGGSSGRDNPPSVFNVNSSTSYTSALVTWEASDDRGVADVVVVYGVTNAYGSSGVVTGNYQTLISGLATGTVYYFKISVTDTGLHTVDYEGQFSTVSAPVPPVDVIPPIISNIQINTGMTTATISWVTDENADSQIIYGLTASYGSNFFDSSQIQAHSVLLFNLSPSTTYHFQIISTDVSGNGAHTNDAVFTTQADNVPPPDVSNFFLATTSNSAMLSWTNPDIASVSDFAGVKIMRKVDSASIGAADGVQVYSGNGESFTDGSVTVNVNYFYTIFSFDTSGNYSPGIFRNGKIFLTVPPVEICGNNIDDNSNGLIDCADPACVAVSQCVQPTTTTPPSEICGNGLDDNSNGLIDCADIVCANLPTCAATPINAACDNDIDDDGDGLMDFPLDSGCESVVDSDEYNAPESTVPSFERISLRDLQFLSGNRKIVLALQGDTLTGLSDGVFSVIVPESALYARPQSMVLQVGDTDRHQFIYNAGEGKYYADLSFPQPGLSQAFLEVDYGDNQRDSVGFKIYALSAGTVRNDEGQRMDDVTVVLLDAVGNSMMMGEYGQLNPLITGVSGVFGWMVPNGSYKISVSKQGFYDRLLSINDVSNNIINPDLVLIARPQVVLEIDPDLPLVDNVKNVAGALAQQTKALSGVALQKIQDVASDPTVQQVNKRVIAPAAITVVVAGAAPLISWLDLLPFLRFLFLQPLMLLGWRKREKWGLVYNSLSKTPIDLAVVRLINAETGKVVQSKVTDSKGHFLFMVGLGKYYIHVQKNNFLFPSDFLRGYVSDGKKADIYHGEIIEVTAPTAITATVPLDPVGAQKKPTRLVWEKIGRRLQTVLSVVGILVTAASLYISPKWYIAALLVLHIVLFAAFRKLAAPPKIKNWGIVYDETSKNPVSRVVARLFNSQFNKLVDTQITDSSGKYYFMAGDAKFYVTYEHKNYHPQKTDVINLEGKDPEPITFDVNLKKS